MYFFVHLMILFITLFKFFLSISINTTDVKTKSNSFGYFTIFCTFIKRKTIFLFKDKLDKLFVYFNK